MSIVTSFRSYLRERLRPKTFGEQGELAAEKHLKGLGYKIVGRRERDKLGEIDLIAVDGRTVVFCEVKTRRSAKGGTPAEHVDEEKQARVTKLALAYLKRHDLLEHAARFDVIAVIWPKGADKPEVQHFQNAFEPVGKGQMFS